LKNIEVENLNKIASDIAIKGIKNSFGIPGGGYSLNLIDEFEKNNIDFHLTKFEGAASIMAATTGFLEDKQGVSISIKGPGLVNSLTGIAFAHFESYPLVHFTEAYNQNTPESFAHKRINQNILVESIVKKNVYCNSRDVFKVIDCACEEEPGPVLIQLADENSVNSNTSLTGIKEIITLSSELLQFDVKKIFISTFCII
jgi:thiamine pyrophosphate-dependent acetolactate synthase large subunit-like protein